MSSSFPVISVCVLVYNHELYLEQCLGSILEQKLDVAWEIIISDDCSADNSQQIINAYKNKYPYLIQVIRPEKNIGVIGSLLNLLKSATGKYIALCEGDDYWIDHLKLKKQLSFLEDHPSFSISFTNRQILTKGLKLVPDDSYLKEVYTLDDVLSGFIPGTQTMMFRNYDSLVGFFARFTKIFSGDRYLAYCCVLQGGIHKLPDITAVYRETGTGVWSRYTPIEKYMIQADQLIDFHKSLGLPIENNMLADKRFTASVNVLVYCMKRPKLLFKKKYWRFVLSPFKMFATMNRFKFFFGAVVKRIKTKK